MNRRLIRLPNALPAVFLALLILNGCKPRITTSLDPVDFRDPPENTKVYAWWHWVDKGISREGITRDLESMKRQGVTGVTILNVGGLIGKDTGVPKVTFASPEWFDMYKWALHEANRLGLTVGAHNCDGWSTSGGPWITPDKSMKEFTWSKTILNGGRVIDTVLSRPHGNLNYYKDAAVIAYPTSVKINSFQVARPEMRIDNSDAGRLLMDGNPLTGFSIHDNTTADIIFSQPFETDKVAIHLRVPNSWNNLNEVKTIVYLKASVDGINYWIVKGLELTGVNKTIIETFPKTRTRYYKIEIKKPGGLTDYNNKQLTELELLDDDDRPYYDPSISHHLEKTASTRFDNRRELFAETLGEENASTVGEDKIIDLTDSVKADSLLHWKAPAGEWVVIRFGYTTTGAMNAPATEEGRGLECDKMDTVALNLHFASFPEKLIRESGRFKGNTFKYLFIDSWECGFQNWTADFAREFEKRRGYSLLPWIPVLCGEVVDNAAKSEAFLNDFRKTISDLISERYYRHFADLCHRQGIQLHTEVIYGGSVYPPLDILKTNSYADLPMFEFWTSRDDESGFVKYFPSERTDFDKPAMAAAVYDKPVLASEAYTGYAHYSEAPWDLKLFGDRAYCFGVNRMVLHSYVHQPSERVPGVTLGPFGSHFNRHNAWWQYTSGWLTYQARIQYVLQKGTDVADVLYYVGDRMPESGNYSDYYSLPPGYNALECNYDLLKQATVKNNKIILPDGHTFRILVLPDDSVMGLQTIYKIGSLVHQGGVIYGPKPLSTLSVENRVNNDADLAGEADKIWGNIDGENSKEHRYGSGNVFWGISLADALNKIKLSPDFVAENPGADNLLYLHKRIGTQDVFFIVNQDDKVLNKNLDFRISGKSPEIWDPMYGTVYRPGIYSDLNGRTKIPVNLRPKQSLIVVFNESPVKDHIIKATRDGGEIFPADIRAHPGIGYPEVFFSRDSIRFSPASAGDYVFTYRSGKVIQVNAGKPEILPVTDLKGKVTFFNKTYMTQPLETDISKLISWTDYGNSEIRYYSGTADYNLTFSVPDKFISGKDSLILSLGNLSETAMVSLNDSLLGYVWNPGFRFNVNGIIKPGENTLKVSVANVYRNRIIGDMLQYGQLKNLWTTSPVDQLLSRYMPLKESGLMGPVEITRLTPLNISRE